MTSFAFGVGNHPTSRYFDQLLELLEQPPEVLAELLRIAREEEDLAPTVALDEIIRRSARTDPHVVAGALSGLGLLVTGVADESVSGADMYRALQAVAPLTVVDRLERQRQFLQDVFAALLARRNDLLLRDARRSIGAVVELVESRVELAAVTNVRGEIVAYVPLAMINIRTDDPAPVTLFCSSTSDESRPSSATSIARRGCWLPSGARTRDGSSLPRAAR
jgi:hypothetical protein